MRTGIATPLHKPFSLRPRENMKFVAVAVFVVFVLAVSVDSASVSLSNSKLTLDGNAHIEFNEPREEVWAGLADGTEKLIPFLDI